MTSSTFKQLYILGESIRFSLTIRKADVKVSVVLSHDEERKSFNFSQENGNWVLNVDSEDIGINKWNYSLWRQDSSGKEVVLRGSFEVVEESEEIITPIDRARKNIEILKNARMGIFETGVKRNKVRDREVERFSPEELLKELEYWETELARLEIEAGTRKRKNMQFYC